MKAQDFTSATASVNQKDADATFDNDTKTGWRLSAKELDSQQHLIYVLKNSGDIK
jgi:hypothetical protein